MMAGRAQSMNRVEDGARWSGRPDHKEGTMKYGARNTFRGKVKSLKKGAVMAQVNFDIVTPATMASVLTMESLEELDLKPGDEVLLVVKAIHVLPVKE